MGKLLLLTLDGKDGKALDKIISASADYIQPEAVQVVPVPMLSFSDFEIKQGQHRTVKIRPT